MKNRGGFTIVETIITLTVSSVLFVTVMLLFSGRQDRVEFSQGLRDIEAQIRDIANDVRNGYVPTVAGGYNCVVSAGTVTISQGSGGGSSCIFAGKAIFFDSNEGQIITYSLAGDKLASNLPGLKPKIITDGLTIDTSEIYKIPAGIKLVKGDKSLLEGYLLGLFFDVSGVGVGSSKTTPVVVRARQPVGPDYVSRKQTIESTNAEGLVNSAISPDGSKLCFKSGTNDQYGIIILQRGINGITTKLEIDRPISTTTGCAQ